ncbi:MAG: peptidase domain-containing ABC transporter [Betaproteobacteria bacterium]|nr:peptidase domain-containing ABC transporter [Betaproteobacteria bacterium]
MLFSSASYAWGLHSICQLHRIPFAPNILLQQIPPPYSLLSFQQAAQAIGLKSALRHAAVGELSSLALPCLAVLKPGISPDQQHTRSKAGAGGEPIGPLPHRLAVLFRCDAEQALYLVEGDESPNSAAAVDFEREYAGVVLLFAREAESATDHAEPDAPAHIFGFGWFVPELLRHKTIWRDVLLASLAIQLMALATPVFTQIIIDKVIAHHTIGTLTVIGIALGVFVLFTAVMSWIRQYLVLHTGNRIDAVLGSRVFEHLFKLPPRYFEARPTGVLVARVQGVETIREFLSSAAVTLILDVPFLLIFLAVMFYYSVALTLITCAVLLAIVVLSLAVTPLLRRRINHQFLLGARNQAFLTEYVSGMETVKSLQMEPQLNTRYGDYLATYLKAGFDTRQLANTYNVAAHGLEQMMMLAILCLGAWIVMESREFTVGMLVAFQMFASRLSQPMLHLVGLWQQFQQADIAVKRLGDIMNAPAEPYSVIPAREAKGDGAIEIRGLSFRHAENLPYLYRDLSFTIKPGACVAIMGPSGSGKSTLARLLQGFYLPSDGAILLDGLDVRHLSANELRQYFGVVPQDTVLFSGTVYENLVLANPHTSFERVVRACKLAEIHDVIEQLPEGYQTRIGEHGVGLSGGQKQRVAIARALLKRPRILIFDEATSSLDAPTAEQFAKTVNRLKGKVTMLFIAHQLPKGLQVDRVITLGAQESRVSVVGNERTDA